MFDIHGFFSVFSIGLFSGDMAESTYVSVYFNDPTWKEYSIVVNSMSFRTVYQGSHPISTVP